MKVYEKKIFYLKQKEENEYWYKYSEDPFGNSISEKLSSFIWIEMIIKK